MGGSLGDVGLMNWVPAEPDLPKILPKQGGFSIPTMAALFAFIHVASPVFIVFILFFFPHPSLQMEDKDLLLGMGSVPGVTPWDGHFCCPG